MSSSQGVVTLIGRVSSALIKSDAERIARGTKGVDDVNNELLVGSIKQSPRAAREDLEGS